MEQNVGYGDASKCETYAESIEVTANRVIQSLLRQAGEARSSQEALHYTQAACNAANALHAITR